MTEPLYWTQSYLREFTASVVAVDAQENALALDRTAFYPGGGGQPCDLGTLTAEGRTLPVTQAKRQGESATRGHHPLGKEHILLQEAQHSFVEGYDRLSLAPTMSFSGV